MVWKALPGDYGSGSYTKELSLVGKNNVAEKVKVMEKPGIFSKDFKVVCKKFARIWDIWGKPLRYQNAVNQVVRKSR